MNKLRLIQCGVGGFGKGWIVNHTSKSPDFDLAAIVDVSPKALAEAGDAAHIPADRRFSSLEESLDRVQADAVLTVTPPAVHVQHARLAFSRGLHLMTEKPLAADIEEARVMVDLARKANRQLVVSQNYRYRPMIQQMKQLLSANALGDFGHGHIDFYIPADFTGTFREKMEYVLLVDMAIHHLDLIRCVTGRNITKVYAQTFRPSWSWYAHHPGLKMVLELSALPGESSGPLPFTYSGDWSARGKTTSWNGDWRLQCAEGCVLLESDKLSLARSQRGFNLNYQTEALTPPAIEREGQAATLHNFAQAIRTGQPAETSGEDNLWSFGAVTAGVLSAQQGQAIDVAALIGRQA